MYLIPIPPNSFLAKLLLSKGRVVRLDRAVDAGRHGRRLGADVSRVITIILSRRPIVLSTFLSSGFITLFNLSYPLAR